MQNYLNKLVRKLLNIMEAKGICLYGADISPGEYVSILDNEEKTNIIELQPIDINPLLQVRISIVYNQNSEYKRNKLVITKLFSTVPTKSRGYIKCSYILPLKNEDIVELVNEILEISSKIK